MNKIAFLPLLLIIGSLHAYGQVPEEYYEESQLYQNKKSNDQLALSIDEYLYGPGGTVNVFGIVKNYQQGIQVLIEVYDPAEKQIVDLSSLAASDGNFRTPFEISRDAIDGNYTVTGKYGPNGKAVSLFFTIKNIDANIVRIPFGSNTGDEKFNFNPSQIMVKFGAEITWINNDNGVHTVASGKSGINNVMYADGLFDSGPFGPHQNFTQSFFKEGNYQYFCKLHPWLTGQITVSPYSGPPDQKPVPLQEPSEPSEEDNYLFITTERYDLQFHNKTLFDDNIASVFKPYIAANSSSTISISDSSNAKVGTHSLRIQVDTPDGKTTAYHDYATNNLQDWSHYNYLNFWFKGQNTKKTIDILVRDKPWQGAYLHKIVDDSSDWKKIRITLYANQKIDLSMVRGLEFDFTPETKGEFFIDDAFISVSTDDAPKLELDKDTYVFGETIFVAGNVTTRESDNPVTIKVINPLENIVTVNQLILNSDNTFSFALPVVGNQFKKEGLYNITAQYGFLPHKASTSFTMLSPQLVETYKGFDIYRLGNNAFYSILQKEGDFDITRVRSDQYSVILSGISLGEIKETIDETKSIVKPNPSELSPSLSVPDDILLAIWENRKDLQKAYPEAAQGNLINLKKWAENFGWDEDIRLAVLIPSGEVPKYMTEILLAIWNERPELQKAYPEAAQGNLINLMSWAKTFGWDQDERLAMLVPPGKVASYSQSTILEHRPSLRSTDNFMSIVIGFVIVIGGLLGYRFYRTRKKINI